MLIGGSFSYLYFKKQGENTNVIKSGCLKISLSESSGLKLENEVPVIDKVGREKTPYTVTLTNTCNTDAYFKTTLNVLDSSNTDNISKTKLAVSGDRTINSLLISELMKAKLSNTPSNVVDTYLIDRGYIGVGESITYNIKLWIDYEATSYTGSFVSKIIVDSYVKGQEPIYLKSNLASTWKDKVDNEFNYLALYTLGTKELPSTYTYNNEVYNLTNTVDVSEQKNSEVLLGEYTNSDKIIALIGQEEGVIAPTDSDQLFSGFTSVHAKFEEIDLNNFDTSNVINMDDMFYGCNSLKKLKISNLDTRNAIYMCEIFSNCSLLEEINVINFDTRNAIRMWWLFNKCYLLTNLDLSSFDTSKVAYMEGMFNSCANLTNLDLSNFDTSNVANMRAMFSDCSKLINLNLSSFNTSKVTNMNNMFYNTPTLAKIEVGCNWIVNEGTSITNMFYNSGVSKVTKVC